MDSMVLHSTLDRESRDFSVGGIALFNFPVNIQTNRPIRSVLLCSDGLRETRFPANSEVCVCGGAPFSISRKELNSIAIVAEAFDKTGEDDLFDKVWEGTVSPSRKCAHIAQKGCKILIWLLPSSLQPCLQIVNVRRIILSERICQ